MASGEIIVADNASIIVLSSSSPAVAGAASAPSSPTSRRVTRPDRPVLGREDALVAERAAAVMALLLLDVLP